MSDLFKILDTLKTPVTAVTPVTGALSFCYNERMSVTALSVATGNAGNAAIPCPADLLHDACVIAEGNGCTMVEAMDGAAISCGFDDLHHATAAILADWRQRIRLSQPQSERGRKAVRDGLRLLDDAGGDLVANGWSASDLFGVDSDGNGHGLALLLTGGQVDTVTADSLSYRRGAVGRLCTLWRGSVDALPLWEFSK